jgi:hypothetical protein
VLGITAREGTAATARQFPRAAAQGVKVGGSGFGVGGLYKAPQDFLNEAVKQAYLKGNRSRRLWQQ